MKITFHHPRKFKVLGIFSFFFFAYYCCCCFCSPFKSKKILWPQTTQLSQNTCTGINTCKVLKQNKTSFSSVQSLSCVRLFATPWIAARPPCASPSPGVHSNSRPSSQWCYPAISSSVIPFSSCPQSFPASRSFRMSQLFTSGGQSTGVSASTSVLPMNTQDWSPLERTGWISLQSNGLSRVFSNTKFNQNIK